MLSPLETVKRALQAYLDKDRAAMEAMIADEYRFTSPRDNALDRGTYFARCWPASEVMTSVELIHGSEDGELAWIHGPRRNELAVVHVTPDQRRGDVRLRDVLGASPSELVRVVKPDLDRGDRFRERLKRRV